MAQPPPLPVPKVPGAAASNALSTNVPPQEYVQCEKISLTSSRSTNTSFFVGQEAVDSMDDFNPIDIEDLGVQQFWLENAALLLEISPELDMDANSA